MFKPDDVVFAAFVFVGYWTLTTYAEDFEDFEDLGKGELETHTRDVGVGFLLVISCALLWPLGLILYAFRNCIVDIGSKMD